MFELFKIVWDLVVLRDAARRGQLNWRIWPVTFGFVLLEYCVGLATMTFYISHPEYKPLFIAVMVLMAISFVYFLWWGMAPADKASCGAETQHSTQPAQLNYFSPEVFRHVAGTCCDRTVHRHCSRHPG